MVKSKVKMFNEIAMNNFELLNLLCPYLPDIHFVRSEENYESAVIMAHIIEKYGDGHPNLIISKDMYPVQLCYMYPYTSYLYPIKRKGGRGDESVMIPISEKPNFRYEFWKLVSSAWKFDINKVMDLSPLNFTLFSAINKFPERGMRPLANIYTARDVIQKLVGFENVKIVPTQLYCDMEISSRLPVNIIESRMNALDVKYMLPIYNNSQESKMLQFVNLEDHATVNQINAKFFSHNPLDLGKL